MSVILSCCNLRIPNQEYKMSFVRSTKTEDNRIKIAPIEGRDWSYCPFCGVEVTA